MPDFSLSVTVDVNIQHVSLYRTKLFATIHSNHSRKVIEWPRCKIDVTRCVVPYREVVEHTVAILYIGIFSRNVFLSFDNCKYFAQTQLFI